MSNILDLLEKIDANTRRVNTSKGDIGKEILSLLNSNPAGLVKNLQNKVNIKTILNDYFKKVKPSDVKNDPDFQLFFTALVGIISKTDPKLLHLLKIDD